jgi:hypothetical protein
MERDGSNFIYSELEVRQYRPLKPDAAGDRFPFTLVLTDEDTSEYAEAMNLLDGIVQIAFVEKQIRNRECFPVFIFNSSRDRG